MSSVDNRIVNMQFNNKGFESGVATTLNSLKKLNESLKMKTESSGFNKISEGISNLRNNGLTGLSSGVETVSARFSALSVIGATALANITNSAMNAGKKLANAFLFDPITTGFSEYETKMGSIQTILTNTAHQGTTLEDVTGALDELNTYADKTIYNFAEMTKNIGTFTAAGIDLDTSTAAIKGIANLAAASGSNAQQASSAMYQLSQALAAGKVSLADWNSVVNAGMGGKLFQDALIRTSEQLGTGAEAMIEKYGSFRESLTKGEWLTAEVLTETLKQLSGAYTEADLIAQGFTESQAKQIVELANNATAAATEVKTVTQLFDTMKESVQSGWAISWEHILGDKNEATELLTGIKEAFDNLIGPSTEARNNMLAFWNEAGGRNAVIRGLSNIFESLGKGMGAIGDAWKEVFPPMTGEKLVELSTKFRDFTYKLKMSEETVKKIKDTFKGVFDVFDTVKDSVFKLVSGFTPLTGMFKTIGGVALDAASGIGRFASNIADAVRNSDIFGMIAKGLKTAFTFTGDIFSTLGGNISKIFDGLGNLDFSKAFSGIGKVMGGIGAAIKPVLDGIGQALGSFNFDTLFNILKSAAGIGILKTLKGMFSEVSEVADSAKSIFDSFKGIGSGVKEALGSVKETLESYQQNLKADVLMKIAGAIAILAGSLLLLSSIDTGKLTTGLAGMGVIFAELSLAAIAISKFGGGIGLKTSVSLTSMATSMLILAAALKVLSSIKIGEMMTGILGLAVVIGAMSIAVNVFDTKAKNLKKTASSLIIFGAALMVMAGALKLLGSIDAETLGSGLIAMAGVLIELGAFLAIAKYGSLSMTTAAGVLILAGALIVLQQALQMFGKLDTNVIVTGLAAMAGVLAEVLIFDKLSGSSIGMLGTAAGLMAMSAAMLVMSASLKSLGAIQWDEMARGLVAMAGGLAILGVASALMSGGQLLILSVGLGAMSASLLLLSAALQSMGSMTWEEIGKGLLVLAGSLTILAVAMYAMTGAIVGAAAMVVMAAALAILTPQLLLLGGMDLAGVGIMLLALAGAFTVLGLAGLLLTPVVPTLALLGAAVALLGVGCLAAGAGITALGTGLGLVGAAIAGSGTLILEFVKQLINLLPQMALKAGEAMVNFVKAVGNGASELVGAFAQIMGAIIAAAGTMIPQIVQLGLDLAVGFIEGLSTAIPQMVTAGMELVVGVLEGVASNIGQLVTAGLDIVINFLDGVASGLPQVIASAINLALSFIEGIAEGLNSNQGRLEAAIRNIITAVVNAGIAVLKGAVSGFGNAGKALFQGLINGVKSMYGMVTSAVKSGINKAKQAASNLGSALVGAGKSLVQGLINGIKSMAQSVWNAAKSVVTGAINAAKSALKINSPSKVFIEIGKYTTEGFAVGLEKNASMVDAPMRSVAQRAVNSMTDAIRKVSQLSESGIDYNPTITPVLDLSNIQEGSETINSMLGSGNRLALNANVTGVMSRSIGRIQNDSTNHDVVKAVRDLEKSMSNNAGNTYQINGITYDDGSNVQSAVETLIRAAMIERRM